MYRRLRFHKLYERVPPHFWRAKDVNCVPVANKDRNQPANVIKRPTRDLFSARGGQRDEQVNFTIENFLPKAF
jgi:hypothetical protein